MQLWSYHFGEDIFEIDFLVRAFHQREKKRRGSHERVLCEQPLGSRRIGPRGVACAVDPGGTGSRRLLFPSFSASYEGPRRYAARCVTSRAEAWELRARFTGVINDLNAPIWSARGFRGFHLTGKLDPTVACLQKYDCLICGSTWILKNLDENIVGMTDLA